MMGWGFWVHKEHMDKEVLTLQVGEGSESYVYWFIQYAYGCGSTVTSMVSLMSPKALHDYRTRSTVIQAGGALGNQDDGGDHSTHVHLINKYNSHLINPPVYSGQSARFKKNELHKSTSCRHTSDLNQSRSQTVWTDVGQLLTDSLHHLHRLLESRSQCALSKTLVGLSESV